MGFAEKAKPLWEKGKLTQKEIAKLTGVSESMISRYLSGDTVPKEDIAEKILEVLAAAIPKEEDTDMKVALDHLEKVYESHITELKNSLRIERREKWIFVCMLAIVILFVFLLFYVDLTNGNVGWYRY